MNNLKNYSDSVQKIIMGNIKRLQFLYGSIEIVERSLNIEKLDIEFRGFDEEMADLIKNTIDDAVFHRKQEIDEIIKELRGIGYNGTL